MRVLTLHQKQHRLLSLGDIDMEKYIWFNFLLSLFACFNTSYWLDVAMSEESLDAKLVPIENRHKKYFIFRKKRRGMYFSRVCMGMQISGYIVHIPGALFNLFCPMILDYDELSIVGDFWLAMGCVYIGVFLIYGGYLTIRTKLKAGKTRK